MALREDSFWIREENWHLQDFYMFWDMYHMSDYGHDDYDHDDYEDYCRWREMQGTCDDLFLVSEEGEVCNWYLSWSACEEEFFICQLEEFDDYGVWGQRDCAGDFTDIEFWSVMREEQIWQSSLDAEGFHMFWDEWHFGGDDYGHDDYDHHDDYMDCEWKEVYATCDDFEMLEGECAIYSSYSPCNDEFFICEITYPATATTDYLVNSEPCNEDFEDREFWSMMRAEEFWTQHPEYDDFYMFWDMYHADDYGHDDYDHDDYWYDDYENCEWKSVQLQCTDFDLGMEDYDYDGSNCDILIEYNPCVTDYFVC